MKLLVPGPFTTASIKTPDGGELEVRLTDGGHWQIKAKLAGEGGWRPLCRGQMIWLRSRPARCWSTPPVAGSRSGASSWG